jgi:hypothetical protein
LNATFTGKVGERNESVLKEQFAAVAGVPPQFPALNSDLR